MDAALVAGGVGLVSRGEGARAVAALQLRGVAHWRCALCDNAPGAIKTLYAPTFIIITKVV